jgi:hypothetical protein
MKLTQEVEAIRVCHWKNCGLRVSNTV